MSPATLKLTYGVALVASSYAFTQDITRHTLNSISLTVSSNAGLRMSEQPSVDWISSEVCDSEEGVIIISPEKTYQSIGGFGASMTEASAMNLNSLSDSMQSELLGLVFSDSGAKFSGVKKYL